MSDTQGNFVWHELATSDPKGAIAFYKNVIGWSTQPFGDDYTVLQAGETGVGGVAKGTPPHWIAYVYADDVDALTKKAESLGAKTKVPPSDIPTIGRFSVIADPQGAEIALFKPLPREGAEPAPPTTRFFSWNELMTDDPEAALRFYSQLFGWQKTDAVESPMGIYQMYGKGGRTFGGMAKRPKDYPAPPHWLYYVNVGDLDAALARVRKAGGQVLHGPMAVPGGDRVAQCTDPQHARFALHGK
jgi:predicted enzyme related to lactoylglutathione lyase